MRSRDPNRIPQILDTIKKIWELYPDLRLGQLFKNVLSGSALYYVEDSDLIEILSDYYLSEEKFEK